MFEELAIGVKNFVQTMNIIMWVMGIITFFQLIMFTTLSVENSKLGIAVKDAKLLLEKLDALLDKHK